MKKKGKSSLSATRKMPAAPLARARLALFLLLGLPAGCVQYHAAPLSARGADEFAARRIDAKGTAP